MLLCSFCSIFLFCSLTPCETGDGKCLCLLNQHFVTVSARAKSTVRAGLDIVWTWHSGNASGERRKLQCLRQFVLANGVQPMGLKFPPKYWKLIKQRWQNAKSDKTNQREERQTLTARWCPWGCPWAESAVHGYCSAPLYLSMCKDLDSEGSMANRHSPLYLEKKKTDR